MILLGVSTHEVIAVCAERGTVDTRKQNDFIIAV